MRSAAPSVFWRKRLLLGLTTLASARVPGTARAIGRIEIGSAVAIASTTTEGVRDLRPRVLGAVGAAGNVYGPPFPPPSANYIRKLLILLHNCHSACNIDPLSRGIGVQN
jgi:hypothetical protein